MDANGFRPEIEHVMQVLEDFSAQQREHRALAASGRLGGVEEWGQARQAHFVKLQAVLDHAMHTLREPDADPEVSYEIRRIVGNLLRDEEKLEQSIADQRDQIEKQLAALRSGKKTLRGYGRIQPGSFSPRFLSSRT